MEIKAVAFDIDGTLYPNASMYLRSAPFFLTHLRQFSCFSRVRKEIRTMRPVRNFKEIQAQLFAKYMGIPEEKAKRIIENSFYKRWESTFRYVKPFPNIKEILSDFKAAGLKLGVMSDFPVDRKLRLLGLDDYWDCMFSSEDTGYLKPEPEPFLALAECLKIPPANILYVGNNYEYDIIGAKNAGMLTAHLTKKPISGGKADISFFDYKELRDIVLRHRALG